MPTARQRAEAIALIREGHTIRDAARLAGVASPSSVAEWCRAAGVRCDGTARRHAARLRAAVEALQAGKLPLSEVARRCSVSESTLRKHVTEAGIQYPRRRKWRTT